MIEYRTMATNSFDKLVSGLTEDERQGILDRMKSSSSEQVSMLSPVETASAEGISISTKIKNESTLFKIYLWLKSVFASSTPETVYNEVKLTSIARNIEKNFPGLIDSKKGNLLTPFYDRLKELKAAADYFRPYLVSADHDEGNFIVFLSSLVIPDVTAEIESKTDPFQNPISNEIHTEYRVDLLRNLDEIFKNIPREAKNQMYEAMKSVEWLKQFAKLPFTRFLSLFSSTMENVYTCPFSQLESEIGLFAKTLSWPIALTDEVLEALYLFSEKNSRSYKAGELDADAAANFMNKAKSNLTAPKVFMSSVPICSIGSLVYSDISWRPENFSGGEEWFVKYKNSWKKLFEIKWNIWLQECKKEQLRGILNGSFALEKFPILPYRPWAGLRGISFKFEHTAGFINWYFKEKFAGYELNLKTLLVEGNFNKKENRQAFTDSYNQFIQISINFAELNRKLQNSGEIGSIFQKVQDDQTRTLQGQEKVEQLIRRVESDVYTDFKQFCDNCRIMNAILNAVLGIHRDTKYDGISNFSSIQGHDNEKFINQISETNASLEAALSLAKELEVIDSKNTSIDVDFD